MLSRSLILIVSMQLLFSISFGQDKFRDSMLAVIAVQKEDTNKVNLLNKLAYETRQQDPSSIDYAKQALVLAKKLNYTIGQAQSLKNIGLFYIIKGEYVPAQEYCEKALAEFTKANDLVGESNILNNLGSIQFNMSNYSKAMEYYMKSYEVAQLAKDTFRIATVLNNIGIIYLDKPSTRNLAIDYINQALEMGKKINDRGNMGLSYMNLGDVYFAMGNDSAAFYNYIKATEVFHPKDEMFGYILNSIGNLYLKNNQGDLALKYYEEALKKSEELGIKIYMAQSALSLAEYYINHNDPNKAKQYFENALVYAMEMKAGAELKRVYGGLSRIYAGRGDFAKAYDFNNRALHLTDSLSKFDADSLRLQYSVGLKEKEIELLTKDKDLQELEIKRQKIAKNALMAGLVMVFVIIFILYRDYRNKIRINKILDKQKEEIEGLLLNILPAEVAHELQRDGAATPKYFEHAAVLFTDFKSFTKMADVLSPQELVAELNECFMAFDDIIEKYSLEKIKTIGDSYMCAGGIPTPDPDATMNMIKASFDIIEYLKHWNKKRIEKGMTPWELRIGIHVGPLVAGVVGKKKYAYDIWGSTVNIASRMESAGEPGQVNISASVYELIKHRYDCIYRGKISAKNIGEIDMYFVNQEPANEAKIA
ncbi:tetratricopeptide repeat protein [Flavihumibacter rivuli]|uniref:adenylate/guanylate cyclase domain-containing protein n=1 Tax=Flavihumibacter rivuli TaxID=2838156 RepID=UPI001BDE32AF|nr:adenylate/guanylate cyclase domain-containing protein [Flavihumibacter rivuli]ULQ58281.1 tetratricopeptide repeat protein [Flavihumibacter rivuli]